MRKIILLAGVLAGCASMDRGSDQSLQIVTRNDAAVGRTVCTLSNGDERWRARPSQLGSDPFGEKVVVDRDPNALRVRCDNERQSGETVAISSFASSYLYLDMLSVCLFCVVDAASGAFFAYPDTIFVDMADKY